MNRRYPYVPIILALLLTISTNLSWGQIAAWDLNSALGDETTINASLNNSHLNASVLSRGSGVAANATSQTFNATGWNTTNKNLSDAISNNKYFQATIQAQSGYVVSLATLDVKLRRSTTNSTDSFLWRYSTDSINFTDVGSRFNYTGFATGASNGTAQTQIALSSITALQNVSSATKIYLRLYAWGVNTQSGNSTSIGKSNTSGTYSLAIGGGVYSSPNAFDLSTGNYNFTTWANTSTAGTYPNNMVFHWGGLNVPDPLITDVNATENYELAYNLGSSSRIEGQGSSGFSFLNVNPGHSSAQAGNLGEAVLALNTTGRNNIQVSWKAGTITAGTNIYKLRAQYRVGTTGSYTDLPYSSISDIEYTSPSGTTDAGTTYGPITLPAGCENQPVVQVRWVYYYSGTGSGTSTKINLTDISVTSNTYTWNGTISKDYQVPGNWTPARTTPASGDILKFSSGTADTIINLATETISELNISNGTSVTMQASSASTLTLSKALTTTANTGLTLDGSNAIIIDLSSATGSITVGGNITVGSGATLSYNPASAGVITLNGSSIQTISGAGTISLGANAGINVTNTAGVTFSTDIAIGSSGTFTLPLTGSGVYTFSPGTYFTHGNTTANSCNFNGRNVVLQSNASGTAALGSLASAPANATNVTAERYIPAKRAWRLVCVPLMGSANNSVKENWLNNLNATGTTGVEIWAPGTGTNGILTTGVSSSMRIYNNANDVFYAVTNGDTALFAATSNIPFMQFITGPYGSNNVASGATATTLRASGSLITGTHTVNYAPTTGRPFEMIANPYACAVDFDNVYTHSTNILHKFYTVNPNVNTFGGFCTGIYTGGIWNFVPVGLSQTQYIQSGQAFFVEADATGISNNTASVQFQEADKVTSASLNNQPVFRTNGGMYEKLAVNLLAVPSGNAAQVIDGFLEVCHENFSNAVIASEDAVKFGNFNENLFIKNGSTPLAIESRQLFDNGDTLKMGISNMRAGNFQLQFIPSDINAPGLTAMLLDKYLNTQTAISLSGNTTYPFTVNTTAGSYASGRFEVVFNGGSPLTLNFINVRATRAHDNVVIDWQVANEDNITSYTLQKSTDGTNFTTIANLKANNSGNYTASDDELTGSSTLYRIEATETRGKKIYSKVVKLSNNSSATLGLYPNPAKDNMVQVQVSNLEKGAYTLAIYNAMGQQVQQTAISLDGISERFMINIVNIATGVYEVKLMSSNGNTVVTQTLIKQ